MDRAPFQNHEEFTVPQEPEDEWAAQLYRTYGLSPKPSMAERADLARVLWEFGARHVAAEVVLGRRVDTEEIKNDTFIASVMNTYSSQGAVTGLTLLRDMELFGSQADDSELSLADN